MLFRTVSCMCASNLALLSHRDTDIAHVATVVKRPNRKGVVTVAGHGKIHRISLQATIGNPVVGKDFVPGASIHTHVRAFDAAGGILDLEYCARAVADDLGRDYHPHRRRRVVYVDRLADALTGKRIALWIVEDI